MRKYYLLLTAAPLLMATPAHADDAASSSDQAASAAPAAPAKEVFSTGVAKGRDILDSAISTSSLKETEIQKYGARSLGEVLRNIPGVRVEYSGGEGNSNITIRGLPLAQSGSKFLQLQEDGLPTLEFGDITGAGADMFLRTDISLAHVEAIRGGSASTFASNSPGGIINLTDKTGDVEGGSVIASAGVNYDDYRVDGDYGHKLSDTLRFHIGGFYHQGAGPRETGYQDAFRGGQVKFNITKTFDGGYIRLYAKYLDDRNPAYVHVPVTVSGTNANPTYGNIANFNALTDTLYSRNYPTVTQIGANNGIENDSMNNGTHAKAKSIGLEGQYETLGWTFTDKFRYSEQSGSNTYNYPVPQITGTADEVAPILLRGGTGNFVYASGPNTGQTVPGNAVVVPNVTMNFPLHDLDYLVNDFRANRVWQLGGGELTTTVGYYHSRQNIAEEWLFTSNFLAPAGGGNTALVNLVTGGFPVTQNGVLGYGGYLFGSATNRTINMAYSVDAPFGSLNYHVGKLAIGGSVRYDFMAAHGTATTSVDGTRDINGDGVLSPAENMVAVFTGPASPVNYHVKYVSYSMGANYRLADSLSVFGRYSRGGRAAADRILLTTAIAADGSLADPSAAVDHVNQAEGGFKYRQGNLNLYLTGFWAKSTEHNFQISRVYRAYGLEFEGSYREGPFIVSAGATYTKAKIVGDEFTPADIGDVPQHQPKFMYQVMPQYEDGRFSVGANVVGQTMSYAANLNQLVMPGYVIVSPFVQFRPVNNLVLSVNANNVFNKLAFTEVEDGSIPASGITTARVLNGRTISTSLRFNF